MDEYASLIHTKWDCKIYLVFIPKYRRKVLYKPFAIIWVRFFTVWSSSLNARLREGNWRRTMCIY